MPVKKLTDYLDANNVKYIMINHSPAYTAREAAASTLVPRREFAKTIIVNLDGEMAMAVVPASRHVDLPALAALTEKSSASLLTEDEFKSHFPDCDTGAMPPFGNLYNLPVYVDTIISNDDDISFHAGTHTQVIRLSADDYLSLVKPVIGIIAVKE